MHLRTALVYLSLLSLSACTKSCKDYDNNEEFSRAALPAYTETGANTLGCRLGPQVWTVLGSHSTPSPFGSWTPNDLEVYGNNAVPSSVTVVGQMTGVRNSKEFYDTRVSLIFQLTDTLGGLRLLGTDTARTSTGRFAETMTALDFLTFKEYGSLSRRPVRLTIRRLNRQQRTASGTFEGYLYSRPPATDSLAVTEGRFDFKY